jgi:hypothetical protein
MATAASTLRGADLSDRSRLGERGLALLGSDVVGDTWMQHCCLLGSASTR